MWIRSALLSVFFGATALAAPDATLSAIRAANANLSSLKGEFTQRNRLKLFKQELTSKGVLLFRPPRQVRWEYKTPDPSTMILDGKTATLTMPGQSAQVFDLDKDATMRAVFDQIAMWLAPTASAEIDKHYEITSTTNDGELLLTPRSTSAVAKAFSKIALRFDPKTWLLRSILLVEKNLDEKEIVFEKLSRDQPLPPAAFAH